MTATQVSFAAFALAQQAASCTPPAAIPDAAPVVAHGLGVGGGGECTPRISGLHLESSPRRGPYALPAGASVIRRLRFGLGLTQPEAAERCCIPLRTYQRAEVGDYVDPAARRAIERALGATW